MLNKIELNLPVRLRKYELMIPFDKGSIISVLRKAGAILSEEFTAEGTKITAVVEEPLWHMVDEYRI